MDPAVRARRRVALVLVAPGLAVSLFGGGVVVFGALVAGIAAYVVIVYAGDHFWVGARPSHRSDVVNVPAFTPSSRRVVTDMYDERAADESPLMLPADC